MCSAFDDLIIIIIYIIVYSYLFMVYNPTWSFKRRKCHSEKSLTICMKFPTGPFAYVKSGTFLRWEIGVHDFWDFGKRHF